MVLWWAGGQGRAFANLALEPPASLCKRASSKPPWEVVCPGFHAMLYPAHLCITWVNNAARFAWDIASFSNVSSTSQEILKSQATGTFGDTTTTGLWFSDCPGQREGRERWPVSCLPGRSPLLTTPDKWTLFQGHFPLLAWVTFIEEQGKNLQKQLV